MGYQLEGKLLGVVHAMSSVNAGLRVILSFVLFLTVFSGQVLAAESSGGRWVLDKEKSVLPQGETHTLVGGMGCPGWLCEGRYNGTTFTITVGETLITVANLHVDYKKLWRDVEFTAKFDNPPTTLFPGGFENLKATVSGGGFVNTSFNQNTGINFQYSSKGINLEENSQISINLSFKEESTNPWFAVPEPREGAEISIEASVWPCSIENVLYCNVKWVYIPESEEVEEIDETTPAKAQDDFEDPFFNHPCFKWLSDEQIERLKASPGGVSIINWVEGNVEVLRGSDSEWSPAKEKAILYPGDAIRTGPNAKVRLINKEVLREGDDAYVSAKIRYQERMDEFKKNGELRKAGGLLYWATVTKSIAEFLFLGLEPWDIGDIYKPDYFWIGENTEICVGNFFVTEEPSRGFIDLIKGGVRAIIIQADWKTRENSVIRTRVLKPGFWGTQGGIRGSDVIFTYDPDIDKVGAYVFEGHMDVTNLETGEQKSLTDNQKLVVENEIMGEIQPMSQDEWDNLVEKWGFDVRFLVFESRSKSSGSSLQIPLTLQQSVNENTGNMDLTLSYDPLVLEATEVIKGSLTANSLSDYNIPSQGTIKISLADKAGFSGDGSVAYIVFNVIGTQGSTSPLNISSVSANKADLSQLSIETLDGVFTVVGFDQCRGDCNGDGKISASDALCGLQMSVGKKTEDLIMDANGDGKVTSLDARKILRIATGLE